MPAQPSRKRSQLVGVVSALAGMAFVPAVVGAKPNTLDWARRALHVAARADAMARKPINSARIVDGSVKSVDIAAGAVGTANLKDGSVTAPKLADGSVTARALAPGTIPANSIGNGEISGAKLAD